VVAKLWWRTALGLSFLSLAALGGNGDAAAQEPEAVERLGAKIAACRMLEDPTERLHCYDEAAGRESDAVVPEGVILELAGSGDFDSESFTAEKPWHLRWESEGNVFTVELYNVAGEFIDVIGNQFGSGSD